MENRLPIDASLVIDEIKVSGYLLNEDHPLGAAKARFFKQRGFRLTDWDELAAKLREHARTHLISGEERTPYGVKVTIDCEIRAPAGKPRCIRSVWISDDDAQSYRLITAHPKVV